VDRERGSVSKTGVSKSGQLNARRLRSSAIHFSPLASFLLIRKRPGISAPGNLSSAPGVKILHLGPALFLCNRQLDVSHCI
jgi:hypothetical protein